MTLALTLLFTLNLYLKLQRVSRREATILQIDRARNWIVTSFDAGLLLSSRFVTKQSHCLLKRPFSAA